MKRPPILATREKGLEFGFFIELNLAIDIGVD
jgi:hypothetical protein